MVVPLTQVILDIFCGIEELMDAEGDAEAIGVSFGAAKAEAAGLAVESVETLGTGITVATGVLTVPGDLLAFASAAFRAAIAAFF